MSEVLAKPATFRERLYASRKFERLLEIFPGTITWSALLAPLPLSYFAPTVVAFFIISFDLFMLVRWVRLSFALVKGYRRLRLSMSLDWARVLVLMERPGELHDNLANDGDQFSDRQKHYLIEEATRVSEEPSPLPWRDVWHMVLLANYKEGLEITEPAVKALAASRFDVKERVVLVMAVEERGGPSIVKNAEYLKDRYGEHFADFIIAVHPKNLPDEGKTKGPNVTYAAKKAVLEYFVPRGIDEKGVAVTVFDADTVAHEQFLSYLTYMFATSSDRKHTTFQPIPFFYNNIWDAPATSRIISTGSSFWQIIESTRPHRLRNFSSHTMSLAALIEIDYWDPYSINDDSRQFWRAYFTYHGRHHVVPLWIPLFNDAVLSPTIWQSFKNQYLQLKRWAYGVSEFPYVIRHFVKDTKIDTSEKIVQTVRLFEGHFTWATAPLFMAFVAWLPVLINTDFRNEVLVYTLPNITSNILTLGLIGLVITIFLSLLMLPPRPARHGPIRQTFHVLQWVLMPITTIFFSSFPAIDAQTRLMFARYMEFRVTEKARKGL